MTLPISITPVVTATATATVLVDASGAPLVSAKSTPAEWTAKLRDLYGKQGIEPRFRQVPDGILASWGDVEMTHDIGRQQVADDVGVAVQAMRRGPLYGSGGGR